MRRLTLIIGKRSETVLIYLASEDNHVEEGKIPMNKVAHINNLRVKLADLCHVSVLPDI